MTAAFIKKTFIFHYYWINSHHIWLKCHESDVLHINDVEQVHIKEQSKLAAVAILDIAYLTV